MPRLNDNYIFVLWGDKFEEVTATIFVTELRKAGFLVKLVGLIPPPIKGVHGLALVPDLTLNQALTKVSNTMCIILPSVAYQMNNFKADPRVRELFQRLQLNEGCARTGHLREGGGNVRNISERQAPNIVNNHSNLNR